MYVDIVHTSFLYTKCQGTRRVSGSGVPGAGLRKGSGVHRTRLKKRSGVHKTMLKKIEMTKEARRGCVEDCGILCV